MRILLFAILSATSVATAEVPRSIVKRYTTDSIELNHFYNNEGKLNFSQVIFWEWSEDDQETHVRHWVLLKGNRRPVIDHARRCVSFTWEEDSHYKTVRANAFHESWTLWDPELDDRSVWGSVKRKKFR